MARGIYVCRVCQHWTTRKGNAKRHIRDVHKGAAHLLEYPVSKMSVARGNSTGNYGFVSAFDTPFAVAVPSSIVDTKKNKNTDDDEMLNYLVNQSKKWVELQQNLRKLSGNNNNISMGFPQFMYGYHYPAAAFSQSITTLPTNPQAPILNNTANRPSTPSSTFSSSPDGYDVLGTKCYICKKCFEPDFVPFYLCADPKSKGGLPTHRCERREPLIEDGEVRKQVLETLYQQIVDAMVEKFNDWTRGRNYLCALQANSLPSFPAELNQVKFGSIGSSNNQYLLRAANEKVTALTKAELHDFVQKTHGTYALCEFEYNSDEIKKFYFMFIYGDRRKTAPGRTGVN